MPAKKMRKIGEINLFDDVTLKIFMNMSRKNIYAKMFIMGWVSCVPSFIFVASIVWKIKKGTDQPSLHYHRAPKSPSIYRIKTSYL